MLLTPAQIKPKSFESRRNFLFLTQGGCVSYLRACLGARLLPQSYQYPNLSEGADRVGGQLRGDKECPFSGVTKSDRVWRKVRESDVRSVVLTLRLLHQTVPSVQCSAMPYAVLTARNQRTTSAQKLQSLICSRIPQERSESSALAAENRLLYESDQRQQRRKATLNNIRQQRRKATLNNMINDSNDVKRH